VGAGARGAADEIIRVADLLGAGVAKALLGKDVLPDDLPAQDLPDFPYARFAETLGLVGVRVDRPD